MTKGTPSSAARRAGRPSSPVPRDVLIGAAVVCFADAGYAAASLGRIAEACGIRKSSLLHRFGSKETLYLEALSTVLGRLGGMVAEAAAQRNGGDEQQFPVEAKALDEVNWAGARPNFFWAPFFLFLLLFRLDFGAFFCISFWFSRSRNAPTQPAKGLYLLYHSERS